MKIITKLLGILLIFVAIYNRNFSNLNQIIISILLFLSGVSMLLRDSKYNTISVYLMRIAGIIAILFIIKQIFIG